MVQNFKTRLHDCLFFNRGFNSQLFLLSFSLEKLWSCYRTNQQDCSPTNTGNWALLATVPTTISTSSKLFQEGLFLEAGQFHFLWHSFIVHLTLEEATLVLLPQSILVNIPAVVLVTKSHTLSTRDELEKSNGTCKNIPMQSSEVQQNQTLG